MTIIYYLLKMVMFILYYLYSNINGHKVGESRPGFWGGLNHYDDKGHKRGHSNPGFLGGFNHYDD